MKIGIIETDQPREPLNKDFGRYSKLFEDWLSPALPEATFTGIAAFEMEALPDPKDYDGFLLTGSRHGVYDKLPWMEPLKQTLLQARDANIPVGGICFGHQIMAEAYGGIVKKADVGWVLGRETYRSSHGDDAKSVYAIHQDQVIVPPSGVDTVHQSERVPYGRLEYAFSALSVQYHPEFHTRFFNNLMTVLSGSILDKKLADEAIRSTELGTDAAVLADDFATFFRTR